MIPGKGTSRLRGDLGIVVTEDMISGAPMQGFIAGRMAPYFPVGAQAATFPVIPLKALFNTVDTTRASGAGYSRSEEPFEAGFYATHEEGHEMPVDMRFKSMYARYFDLELYTARLCEAKVLRSFETTVATKLHKSGSYLTSAASVAWNDYANADPKADVRAGTAIMRAKGVLPNVLQVSWVRYMDLTQCKAVKDAVYAIFPDAMKTGTITISHLSAYLEIEVVVAGAQVNAANKNKTAALDDIWSNEQAMLARVAMPGEDIAQPSVARTFLWNETPSTTGKPEIIVEDYYEERTRSQIARVRHDIDVRQLKSYDDDGNVLSDISKNCGCHITGIYEAPTP